MNYQEFIKNIYTSLKSINLKQQKLEEHFQTTFKKIDYLNNKVDNVSNKLDDFIETSNRLKEVKQIELSNSLSSITENLENIQIEQDDIITTMSDVRNIEENMSVLLDDYLSNEYIINDDTHNDLPLDNPNTNILTIEENKIVSHNSEVLEENIVNDTIFIESNTDNTKLSSSDIHNELEDDLLILE